MTRTQISVLLFSAAMLFAGCAEQSSPSSANSSGTANTGAVSGSRRSVAFVTNQIADFWKIAESGARDAAAEFDLDVEVVMPPEATAVVQKQKVEDLLTSGIQAIAISPLDADNQIEWLNSIGRKVPLITQDSDAPQSERLMYIGMDNYAGGRACGELVVKAVPDGGSLLASLRPSMFGDA